MSLKRCAVGPALWLFSLAAYGADALVTGYHLKPASATVKTGGTVKLKLGYCEVKADKPGAKPKAASSGKPGKKSIEDDLAPPDPNSKPKSIEDDLAPLLVELVCEGDEGFGDVMAPLVLLDVQWRIVDGQGRVSGDQKGATYHAPASRPKPNQATVSATVTYNVGKEKTILLSRMTILDVAKIYEGTFTQQTVQVLEDYTSSLAGKIRWTFDEYDEDSKWREYVGKGKAAFTITRKGCGGPASFTEVPVEGQLKVHDDGKYDFQINLVSDEERKRKCHRPELDKDLKWDEPFSPAGEGMHSGDPCSRRDTQPHSPDPTRLEMGRNASCDENLNRIQEGWSFKALE